MSKKLLWIGLAALAIRLLYLLLNPRPIASDELEYQNLAVNLTSHFRYELDSIPTAYRPVGYPAFVALIYAFVGVTPFAVKVVQAIVDSTIVFLLPRLIENASDRVKILTAACWAIFPPAILYPNLLMSESVYTALLVAAAVLLVGERSGTTRHILAGAVFGILTLMKPATVVFVLALIAIDIALTKMYQRAIVAFLVFAVVVTPWILRNWVMIGEPTVATNSGINLLIGNNPNANGSYMSKLPLSVSEATGDEASKDQLAFRTALSFIIAHPNNFIVNALKKYAHFFSSESFLLVTQFSNVPFESESLARKYARISPLLMLIVNGAYGLALIAGWFGFLSSGKNRVWYIFIVLLSSFLCVHLITFGGNRFHFPLTPFLVLFAVQNLGLERKGIPSLSRSRRIVFVLGVISFVSIWGTELLILIHS